MCEDKIRMNSEGVGGGDKPKTPVCVCFSLCVSPSLCLSLSVSFCFSLSLSLCCSYI